MGVPPAGKAQIWDFTEHPEVLKRTLAKHPECNFVPSSRNSGVIVPSRCQCGVGVQREVGGRGFETGVIYPYFGAMGRGGSQIMSKCPYRDICLTSCLQVNIYLPLSNNYGASRDDGEPQYRRGPSLSLLIGDASMFCSSEQVTARASFEEKQPGQDRKSRKATEEVDTL